MSKIHFSIDGIINKNKREAFTSDEEMSLMDDILEVVDKHGYAFYGSFGLLT